MRQSSREKESQEQAKDSEVATLSGVPQKTKLHNCSMCAEGQDQFHTSSLYLNIKMVGSSVSVNPSEFRCVFACSPWSIWLQQSTLDSVLFSKKAQMCQMGSMNLGKNFSKEKKH